MKSPPTSSLNAAIDGSGDQLFLGLHGWGGSLHTFDPVMPYVPPSATFLRLSLPGYGGSPHPSRWHLYAIAQTINAALDEHFAHRANPEEECEITLVGNCSGAIFGMLALQSRMKRVGLARDTSPKGVQFRLQRLVMIDAFAYIPWYLRIFLFPLFGRLFYWSSFANPLGRLLTNFSLRSNRAEDTDMLEGFEDIDHQATYQTLRLLERVGSYQRFGELMDSTTEVDILYGSRSFAAIQESAHLWGAMWPHATLHKLSGAGHLPIEEATEAVAEVVWGARDLTS